MAYTVQEISTSLDLTFSGNGDTLIDHVCGINKLSQGGLAFITNPSELGNLPTPKGIFDSRQTDMNQIRSIKGSAIIVPISVKAEDHTLLFSEDPLYHHVQATEMLHSGPSTSQICHPQATIGNNVTLGDSVTIDAHTVVYDNVTIGKNTVIRSGTVVMENCTIGEDCIIYPNVSIRENCKMVWNTLLCAFQGHSLSIDY